MEKQIIDFLTKIILENYNIEIKNIKLETPPKKEFWDFAFGWFLLSKELKKSPIIIVNELKEIVEKVINKDFFIASVICEWPYLNIKINNTLYTKEFLEKLVFLEKKENNNKNKTIYIDYIWTNVWKPLHIAHMCSPNQGQAIINIYKKLWYNVISDSHIWDWWIIFGKLITAFRLYWDENKLKENAVEHLFELYVKITSESDKESKFLVILVDYLTKLWKSNPTKDIEKYTLEECINFENELILNFPSYISEIKSQYSFDSISNIYINFKFLESTFRKEFKQLSKWNPESIKLWEKFTKESIKAMNTQLNRLNVKPDFDIWESFYEWLWLPKIQEYPNLKYNMNDIVNELVNKWIATRNNDWSVWVVFPDETKIPSCVLQKRDWTNLYLTSDLCAIKYRNNKELWKEKYWLNWSLEKIIYFIDVRQQLHLKQAFEIAKIAWWLEKENWEKVELFHAYNWFITLKDWAMSTRHWRIIKLDKLLDEAIERAKKIILEKRKDINWEELNNLAKIIWIWAIKYGYLKKSRETDVVFDWDEFMTFEWNSWPYIQYAYVRAIRILEKEKNPPNPFPPREKGNIEVLFKNSEEIELIKELLNYENILNDTAKTCMPHILAWYCFNLTKKFNTFYNNIQVINEENENFKNLRLLLVQKFSEILKEWFSLLWINMPEKM